jgi:hypothetical protein
MKKMNDRTILYFFPFYFFMIGTLLQLCTGIAHRGITQFFVMLMFMEIYILFVLWFNHEVNKI